MPLEKGCSVSRSSCSQREPVRVVRVVSGGVYESKCNAESNLIMHISGNAFALSCRNTAPNAGHAATQFLKALIVIHCTRL